MARSNMIKQQVRTWDVSDEKIVQLFGSIPREHFLPEHLHQLAYADSQLPIGHSQVTMPPKELARALQALNIKKHETVLEIGTGTSYSTALLAELANHVNSVDIFEDFIEHGKNHLQLLGIENASLFVGDAAQGWDEKTAYDVILCTASMPVLPKIFRTQLTIQGRLFVILGEAPVMEALVITRLTKDTWQTNCLFETNMPALLNAQQPDKFVF